MYIQKKETKKKYLKKCFNSNIWGNLLIYIEYDKYSSGFCLMNYWIIVISQFPSFIRCHIALISIYPNNLLRTSRGYKYKLLIRDSDVRVATIRR